MIRIAGSAMIAAIACVVIARMVGTTMARLLYHRSGVAYRPVGRKIAVAYKAQFGPDRNYVLYGICTYATFGFLVIAALFAMLVR